MSSPAKINPPDAEVHNAPDMDPDATAAALEPTRHPFVAWVIASLRIIWSSWRHPGHPVWIDYRTGKVWLKRD